MPNESEVQQALNEPLPACRERNGGVSWPLPIHQRLDDLVKRANSRGAGVNRKILSAALILSATEDPDALLDVVLKFRTSTAGDALIDVPAGSNVVSLSRHRPGPRTAG